MTLNRIIDAIGIEPYYREDAGVIYNADCLDILPKMPEKCVDLVLTDPPYGIGLNYGKSMIDNVEYIQSHSNLWLSEMTRLKSKDGLIAITCGIRNVSLWPRSDWVACWHYKGYDSRCPFGFNQWQPILLYGKDRTVGSGCRPDFFEHLESSGKNGHPCPKPLGLIKKIMLRFGLPDDGIVLDPFLGSGTTAAAAKQLGRKYIGIEIEKKYCDIAVQRLAQEILI